MLRGSYQPNEQVCFVLGALMEPDSAANDRTLTQVGTPLRAGGRTALTAIQNLSGRRYTGEPARWSERRALVLNICTPFWGAQKLLTTTQKISKLDSMIGRQKTRPSTHRDVEGVVQDGTRRQTPVPSCTNGTWAGLGFHYVTGPLGSRLGQGGMLDSRSS